MANNADAPIAHSAKSAPNNPPNHKQSSLALASLSAKCSSKDLIGVSLPNRAQPSGCTTNCAALATHVLQPSGEAHVAFTSLQDGRQRIVAKTHTATQLLLYRHLDHWQIITRSRYIQPSHACAQALPTCTSFQSKICTKCHSFIDTA